MAKQLFALFFLFTFSCSRIEEAKDKASEKVKIKAKQTTKKVWQKGVDKLFENSASLQPAALIEVFSNSAALKIKNETGKRIDFLGGFYQYYFTYNANKNDILQFLNNYERAHPDTSHAKGSNSEKEMLEEKLTFIESKFPKIYDELDFFTEFKPRNNLEFYFIQKELQGNIVIFSKTDNKIYHFVENYQE